MEKHLIRTILMAMTSIGKVEYRIKDEFTGFYRDNILFAKVQEEELYFKIVMEDLLNLNNP